MNMSNKRKERYMICVLIFSVCLLFVSGCGRGEEIFFYSSDETGLSDGKEAFDDMETSNVSETKSSVTKEPIKIYVDVSGAVKHPGVYVMEEGNRVFQAVDAAGGFEENAFQEAVNLACLLEDEEHIYIPFRNSDESELEELVEEGNVFDPADTVEPGKININRAGLDEFMTLTGIGETRARAILAYREEHGKFSSKEELMNVQGIKEGTFAKIKDEIVVK